ncbi:MAG: hypothetical protein ABIP20_03110 [Chthoniobacteraceae bacterium]
MKTLVRNTLALLAFIPAGQAADLVSSGDWTETITAANLISGAGSNLQSQLQSLSGVTTLTISNAPGSWSLRVRRSGGTWPAGVTLLVKRTSAGSGSGTISGGDTFVAVTGSDTEIFSGTEARSNVSLQFKLSGLSVGITPATYLSSIIFTVQ